MVISPAKSGKGFLSQVRMTVVIGSAKEDIVVYI